MTVTVPDDLTEQLKSAKSDEQPTESFDDSTSIEVALDDVTGVGSTAIQHLRESGFTNIGDLRTASQTDLRQVSSIGETTAVRILECVESGTDSEEDDDSGPSGLSDLFG